MWPGKLTHNNVKYCYDARYYATFRLAVQRVYLSVYADTSRLPGGDTEEPEEYRPPEFAQQYARARDEVHTPAKRARIIECYGAGMNSYPKIALRLALSGDLTKPDVDPSITARRTVRLRYGIPPQGTARLQQGTASLWDGCACGRGEIRARFS